MVYARHFPLSSPKCRVFGRFELHGGVKCHSQFIRLNVIGVRRTEAKHELMRNTEQRLLFANLAKQIF